MRRTSVCSFACSSADPVLDYAAVFSDMIVEMSQLVAAGVSTPLSWARRRPQHRLGKGPTAHQ
ncbi:hypothetical protein AB0I98_38595 [Streptomyces sp. NPDC050211]|uniref:hypothetical protein n=1 Tax=Streptomyces sp. NPDC050211 TaxID=3154932 RepID=UPI0034469162